MTATMKEPQDQITLGGKVEWRDMTAEKWLETIISVWDQNVEAASNDGGQHLLFYHMKHIIESAKKHTSSDTSR